jgi:hypothetical protein
MLQRCINCDVVLSISIDPVAKSPSSFSDSALTSGRRRTYQRITHRHDKLISCRHAHGGAAKNLSINSAAECRVARMLSQVTVSDQFVNVTDGINDNCQRCMHRNKQQHKRVQCPLLSVLEFDIAKLLHQRFSNTTQHCSATAGTVCSASTSSNRCSKLFQTN